MLPCKARVIWRRPDCLKPSLQRCKRHTSRHSTCCRGHRYRAIPTFVVLTLPAGGRRAASPFKGTDRDAYVTAADLLAALDLALAQLPAPLL